MKKLAEKVAIVTGAGSGIGQGIALEFFRQGAKLALLDINLNALQDTVKQIGSSAENCIIIQGDVSNFSDVKNFIERVISTFGKVDILVNNAGIYKMLTLLETKDTDWEETITINLRGPFLLIREVVPHMLKNKGGKIINISSSAALRAFPNSVAYTASKGGLLALGRQLAVELGPQQITVNTICPGVIRTPILDKELLGNPEMKKVLESCHPIGRLGTPADVAHCCVYLASEEANLISGTIISVDGAWVCTYRGM